MWEYMISTVIGILLAGQLAGLVVGILRNQNNKYKTDTENFEISAKSASLVLLGCSIVFFAFSFLSTFSVHESDSKVWIAFLVFAVPVMLGLLFSRRFALNATVGRIILAVTVVYWILRNALELDVA